MNPTQKRLFTFLEVGVVTTIFLLLNRWVFRLLVHLEWLTREDGKNVLGLLPLTTVSLSYVLLAMWLSSRIWKFSFIEYGIGLKNFPSLKTIGALILMAAVLQGIVAGVGDLLERLSGGETTVPGVPDMKTLALALLLSFIGGGIREELFYRGYLIKRVPEIFSDRRTGLVVAIVFQLALFGWGHIYQGPIGVTQSILGAIGFTWVYLKFGNLWHAIILHSFFDVWGFALIYLLP